MLKCLWPVRFVAQNSNISKTRSEAKQNEIGTIFVRRIEWRIEMREQYGAHSKRWNKNWKLTHTNSPCITMELCKQQQRITNRTRILWKNTLIESDVYRIENDISRKIIICMDRLFALWEFMDRFASILQINSKLIWNCICYNDDWNSQYSFQHWFQWFFFFRNSFFLSFSFPFHWLRIFLFWFLSFGFLSVRHQHIIIRYFVLFCAYWDMHRAPINL